METTVTYMKQYNTADASTFGTSSGFFLFSGNSVFNPDLNAALENYPVGVPEISNLYDRYQVVASTISVRAITYDAIVNSAVRFCVYCRPYIASFSSSLQSVDDFLGQPNCSKMMMLGPVSGISISPTLTVARSTASVLSRTPSQVQCSADTSGYVTDGTYQPASQWYWFVVFSNANSTAITPPGCVFELKVRYRVRFFAPRSLVASSHDVTGQVIPVFEPDPVCNCVAVEEEKKDPADQEGDFPISLSPTTLSIIETL